MPNGVAAVVDVNAITIHKSRTLSYSVVNIVPKDLSFEATYIAFSRIRRLEDIFIEMPFAKDRLDQIRRIEE